MKYKAKYHLWLKMTLWIASILQWQPLDGAALRPLWETFCSQVKRILSKYCTEKSLNNLLRELRKNQFQQVNSFLFNYSRKVMVLTNTLVFFFVEFSLYIKMMKFQFREFSKEICPMILIFLKLSPALVSCQKSRNFKISGHI